MTEQTDGQVSPAGRNGTIDDKEVGYWCERHGGINSPTCPATESGKACTAEVRQIPVTSRHERWQ